MFRVALHTAIVSTLYGTAFAKCPEGRNDSAPDWTYRPQLVMTPKATRSGYCDVVLDVDASGAVSGIQDIDCTDRAFRSHTREHIRQWKAEPGKAACGVQTRTSFVLGNEKGQILPARGGLEEWDLRGGTYATGMRIRRR